MAMFDSKDIPHCSSQTELQQATESQPLNMTGQQWQQSKTQKYTNPTFETQPLPTHSSISELFVTEYVCVLYITRIHLFCKSM